MKKKESQIPRGFHTSLEPQIVEHRPSKHLHAIPSKDFLHRDTNPDPAAARQHDNHEPQAKPVVFETRMPGATLVLLTGDFTDWATDRIRLHHAGGDVWRAEISLRPGTYQYRLYVDGAWVDDPLATRRVPNVFGTENCILEIP